MDTLIEESSPRGFVGRQQPRCLEVGQLKSLAEARLQADDAVARGRIMIEPPKAQSRTKLPEAGLLACGCFERAGKAGPGVGEAVERHQCLTLKPMDLRFVPTLSSPLDPDERFFQHGQRVLRTHGCLLDLRQQRQEIGHQVLGAGCAPLLHALLNFPPAGLKFTGFSERPARQNRRASLPEVESGIGRDLGEFAAARLNPFTITEDLMDNPAEEEGKRKTVPVRYKSRFANRCFVDCKRLLWKSQR